MKNWDWGLIWDRAVQVACFVAAVATIWKAFNP